MFTAVANFPVGPGDLPETFPSYSTLFSLQKISQLLQLISRWPRSVLLETMATLGSGLYAEVPPQTLPSPGSITQIYRSAPPLSVTNLQAAPGYLQNQFSRRKWLLWAVDSMALYPAEVPSHPRPCPLQDLPLKSTHISQPRVGNPVSGYRTTFQTLGTQKTWHRRRCFSTLAATA